MPLEERQQIINNNRSLRNIKNELENLAEHGAISDEAYDTIMRVLPVESSLNSSSRVNAVSPSPAPTPALNNLSLTRNDSPPAYNNPTPPALPGRTPSAPPSKPELARATALYRYAAEGDCNFEVGDQISVTEYMNAEWWFGKNVRTGQEGVFPVNYVQKQQSPTQPQNGFYGNNEKATGFGGGYPALAAQAQAQQGPPPPGPSNPYNSSVPPMAMANEPGRPSKGGEMGKKFGKKLGNAAIFGAGATIGGNIVNSIF